MAEKLPGNVLSKGSSIQYGVLCFQSEVMFAENLRNISWIMKRMK